MTDQPYYVLNRNTEGLSVLHRDPREECQTDDAIGRSVIDHKTGKALQKSGDIDLCSYCFPKED